LNVNPIKAYIRKMQGKPWFRKDDELWCQQLRWNVTRNMLFDSWNNRKLVYNLAKECLLIEEAQWFVNGIPEDAMDPPYGNPEVFLGLPRSAREYAYIGILTRNYELIKTAALKGDAAAQFRYAQLIDEEYRELWLTKSMEGGYSEAFAVVGERLLFKREYQKALQVILQGIRAASPSSIHLYGSFLQIPKEQILYLTGHLWLIFYPSVGRDFVKFVLAWYEKASHERNRTSGFIIGQFFDKITPAQATRIQSFPQNETFYDALYVAHQMFLIMRKRTQEATFAWMLYGRRLGVVKDIRKIIAGFLWASRDESPWMAEYQSDDLVVIVD
jgi:hypothetical protein